MHVIIVGAGEVGWYLAQRLGAENHDVVVIEQDEVIARALGDELDVQTVVGSGTHPSTLRAARAERSTWSPGDPGRRGQHDLLGAVEADGAKRTVVRLQTDELRGPGGCRARASSSTPISSSIPTPTPPRRS
ncbi:MAG: NAD-binding protein [Ilumatobacteraceae bacterium]